MRTFVIGNGLSRKDFNLTQLKEFGKIIGCNALYRDFTPDALVAVDVNMAIEISDSGIQHKIPVYTNKNSEHLFGFRIITPNLGWSSGSTALYIAAKDAPKEIYLIGFDLISDTEFINNLYAGSKNYKPKNSKAVFHNNWQSQLMTIIKKFPYINFYKVNKNLNYRLPENFNNLFYITYTEFENTIEKWKNE